MTKRNCHVSRRQFLATIGAAGAVSPFVPLLNASGQEATRPKRLVLFFTPHGTVYDRWKPTGTETAFTLPTILAPLERHKKKLAVLAGIDLRSTGVGAPHTKGLPLLWTGSTLLEERTFERSDGSGGRYFGWNSGPSIDQVIAAQIGTKTSYRSIELGVRSGGSHPASRMIFTSARQPLPPEANPYSVFDRLFSARSADLRAERASAIDLIKGELDLLRPRIASEDRHKVDSHLEAVRSIERRLQLAPSTCSAPMPPLAASGQRVDHNASESMPWVLDRQIELGAAALACDLTRVLSLQYTVGDNDNARYTWLGITHEGHHMITHAGDTQLDQKDHLTKIYTWYADRFAYLLDRLDSVPEGTGTMLDNTLVVWGSELGKGNSHSFRATPFVLAGGGAGSVRMGRFLEYPSGTIHNRLLVSVAQAFGMTNVAKFGNTDTGSGPLPRL